MSGLRSHRLLRRSTSGMTLIEIMIVVIIMAVIATGVTMAVLPMLDKAKDKNARVGLGPIAAAATMHMAENDGCPSLDDIRPSLQNGKAEDPWGNDYVIQCSGRNLSVLSAGPDGQPGTEDDITAAE